jgi:hypothetical protein
MESTMIAEKITTAICNVLGRLLLRVGLICFLFLEVLFAIFHSQFDMFRTFACHSERSEESLISGAETLR